MKNFVSEAERRLYEKLHCDLGANIIEALENDAVNEILVNPDGGLWLDTSTNGMQKISELSPSQVLSIINGIAGIHRLVVSATTPTLEAELPLFKSMSYERFIAQVPPVVASPSFSIRKRPRTVFRLKDYLDSGRINIQQMDALAKLISGRKNILVCGGPGSGKTTVTNALIAEAVRFHPTQRFLILEDLPELQCEAVNKVSMLTSTNITMTHLVKAAMRMRPDRIVIGEVRGGEALDMLKAWNTGCPGGICTVHANGAEEAIQRILDLAMEAGLSMPPVSLVKHTIDAIVSVTREEHQKGFISEILTVGEYRNERFEFIKMA